MKIGILVTGHIDEPHFEKYVSYAHMFKQLFKKVNAKLKYEVFDVIDGQWPEYIDSCDGWLITGSASGVYENTPWMQQLKKWIVHAHEKGIPMVGICFGHQIIADVFAGKVERFNGGWSLGPQSYAMKDDAILGKANITLNAVHQDQVIEKPINAQCLASSDFCEYAILMYGDSILTIQAHPEFTNEYEADLLELHKGQAIALEPSQQALSLLQPNPPKLDELIVARWMLSVLQGGPVFRPGNTLV
ncbi:MAG: glutamine amidotransferase [Marinobacter sp.]|uniref:glutamine amidotransferase-related protein n=1 Tax=Marinobacter sp. TaxID=50741 RepID=UPI00396F0EB8